MADNKSNGSIRGSAELVAHSQEDHDGSPRFQDLLEAIFDRNPTYGIVYTDKSGKVLKANLNFYRLTDLFPTEVEGKNSREIIEGLAKPKNDSSLEELIMNVSSGSVPENPVVFYNNKHLKISASITEEGQIVAIIDDVTERVILEDHLRQTEKMRTLGALSRDMAHNFNNLLQAVIGGADFAESDLKRLECDSIESLNEMEREIGNLEEGLGKLPEHHEEVESLRNTVSELKEYAALMRDSMTTRFEALTEDLTKTKGAANEASHLVKALLSLSRPEGGFRFSNSDLYLSLRSVGRKLKKLSSDNLGVNITVEGEEGYFSNVDVGKMEEVLMNIGVNALEAVSSSNGEILLKVEAVKLDKDFCRTVPSLQPGNYVRILIKDDGVGIPAKNMDEIFKPLFTTKEMSNNPGLGLFNAYSVLEEHGGHVTVNSKERQGTEVAVYLPFNGHIESFRKRSSEDYAAKKGLFALVVDDTYSSRDMAVSMLERLGFEVMGAESGEEGIEMYKRRKADLVFMDLQLPEISGENASREILDFDSQARLFIMSADNYLTPEEQANIGISGTINKPFNINDLVGLLLNYDLLEKEVNNE